MYKIDRRGGGWGGPKNRILGIYLIQIATKFLAKCVEFIGKKGIQSKLNSQLLVLYVKQHIIVTHSYSILSSDKSSPVKTN